jgi:hypothetical protein
VAACAENITVVFKEFLQAGPSDVGKLDFGFLGGSAGLTAFEDVSLTRAGSPNHLIVGAGALADKTLAEAHGAIIQNAGFPEGKKVFVTAVRRKDFFNGGLIRRICPIRLRESLRHRFS